MTMIVTDGKTTMVDTIDYDLTREQAAMLLKNGQRVEAAEFPNFSMEEIYNIYPPNVILKPEEYQGMTMEEIIEDLRSYEQFSSVK